MYFDVCVNKYVTGKDFHVVRPASLDNPKDNSVMFIVEKYVDSASIFEAVTDCLIFWPETIKIPANLSEKHAVFPCAMPRNEYCRFYRDNNITCLPPKEAVDFVNNAWIAPNAVIGKGCTIMPGAYIGGECILGNNVYIGAGAKLVGEVIVGNNVIIRENTVIGADGLTTDRDIDGHAITAPQFGTVVLEDDVQVGANTVIARGAIDETRIGRGSKIDNSSFVSHNVHIGDDTFVVGETIMFGSSTVGDRCLISGNSTIMNVVHVGSESIVGAGSVVVKSVPDGAIVKGNPAR